MGQKILDFIAAHKIAVIWFVLGLMAGGVLWHLGVK